MTESNGHYAMTPSAMITQIYGLLKKHGADSRCDRVKRYLENKNAISIERLSYGHLKTLLAGLSGIKDRSELYDLEPPADLGDDIASVKSRILILCGQKVTLSGFTDQELRDFDSLLIKALES
jgi:hypothetical protein